MWGIIIFLPKIFRTSNCTFSKIPLRINNSSIWDKILNILGIENMRDIEDIIEDIAEFIWELHGDNIINTKEEWKREIKKHLLSFF